MPTGSRSASKGLDRTLVSTAEGSFKSFINSKSKTMVKIILTECTARVHMGFLERLHDAVAYTDLEPTRIDGQIICLFVAGAANRSYSENLQSHKFLNYVAVEAQKHSAPTGKVHD